jgi:hypothetical protein
MQIGLHARNGPFEQADFDMIGAARIEALVVMSNISLDTLARLRDFYPNLQFIARLYDDRFGTDHHPSPVEFADKMIPVIASLSPYCQDFQVHNEPNHPAGYEGWRSDDASAVDFNAWLSQVLDYLKAGYPKVRYGFPGLAIPHNDLNWLYICATSVQKCDWLGVHCYWQTTPAEPDNHLSAEWGFRFTQYHMIYPNKLMHITECGNSNNQSGYPLSDQEMAEQLVDYYDACSFYYYIASVCPFIASSPDPTWQPFSWRHPDGSFRPVVEAVGSMSRMEGAL